MVKNQRKVGFGANYYASIDDAVTLAKLVGDLGSFGAKAYIKSYGGKPHIIIKGYPGLRRVLTGTKYGIYNPKVVKMGLGKIGAVKAVKTGGIITIVLLTTYRVVDYVLTDEATLTQLMGTIGTDIVKVGITTGASIATATAFGMATFAIGPIFAVVLVGVGVSIMLDVVDTHYKITEKIISGLDELGDDTMAYIEHIKQNAQNSLYQKVDSVIDYALESAQRIVVKWVHDQVQQYLSVTPRVR